MVNELKELYQEFVLDHKKKPRNHRVIDGPTCIAHGNNPLCGDTVVVFLNLNNEIIEDISFKGDGCAISIASASIMTEVIKGKTKEEAKTIFNMFHNMCTIDDFIVEENNDTDKLKILADISKKSKRLYALKLNN